MKMNQVRCPKCFGVTWTELRFLPKFCAFCAVDFQFSEKAIAENAAVLRMERGR